MTATTSFLQERCKDESSRGDLKMRICLAPFTLRPPPFFQTGLARRPDVRVSSPSTLFFSSRCITSKDEVAPFRLLVAGEAAFHKRGVTSFAVREVTEPPAARCGVLG